MGGPYLPIQRLQRSTGIELFWRLWLNAIARSLWVIGVIWLIIDQCVQFGTVFQLALRIVDPCSSRKRIIAC